MSRSARRSKVSQAITASKCLADKYFLGIVKDDQTFRSMQEAVVIRDERKTTIRYLGNGNVDDARYEHVVLNVCSKHTKEHYIIDMTGAQFRQYQAVTPLAEYVSKLTSGQVEK
jgi:hypothetical protein